MIRGERNWSVERNEQIADGELLADLITHVYAEYEHNVFNGKNILGVI